MPGDADTTSPSGALAIFSDSVSGDTVVSIIFTIVFVWWFIYTLVAGYHWLRFERGSWVAVPILAVHLFVSGWLFLYITSGLH